MEIHQDIQHLEERLTILPKLEEKEKRFEGIGIEEHLREKSQLIHEKQIFSDLGERLNQYRVLHNELNESLPVDSTFVARKEIEKLPNSEIVSEIENILRNLSNKLGQLGKDFDGYLSEQIVRVKDRWNARRSNIQKAYKNLLRELQKTKIDSTEFIE